LTDSDRRNRARERQAVAWITGDWITPRASRADVRRYIRLSKLRDLSAKPVVVDLQMDSIFERLKCSMVSRAPLTKRWGRAIAKWRARQLTSSVNQQ
jgi:hypothetical protein